MATRRKFLTSAALGLAAIPFLTAQDRQRRSRWDMLSHDYPVQTPSLKPDPASWSNDTITAAWIGHATVLINFFGIRIITDPVFSERIGLNIASLVTIGPQRLVHPALAFDELPPIDLILLSHAHMDHLDTPTLKRFDRNIPMVIAKNTCDVVEDFEFEKVYELDWGQFASIGDLRIEALEVKHFGWRFPWEKDRSRGYWNGRSYNAYLVSKNDRHFVFGGDTCFHEHFKKLGERKLPIDIAIMPIGAYDPWIQNHCNPEQAYAMARHMNAEFILPIHCNTFIQSQEPVSEPIERLKRAAPAGRIALEHIGQTWTLNQPLVAEPRATSDNTINIKWNLC